MARLHSTRDEAGSTRASRAASDRCRQPSDAETPVTSRDGWTGCLRVKTQRLRASTGVATAEPAPGIERGHRDLDRFAISAERMSGPAGWRASSVAVRMEPGVDDPRVRYGLCQLLNVIGVRATFDPQPVTTIYYGSEPRYGAAAAIWIPAEGKCRRDGHPPTFVETDHVPVPARNPQPVSLWEGNRLTFDLARAASFWLTLESERHVTRRDAHDRVPAGASLLAAGEWLERPPVHAYARLLAERLRACGVLEEAVPRWPHGKRWAAVLSHDVDIPEHPGRLPGFFKEMIHGGARPRREAYWDFRAEMSALGWRHVCRNPMGKRYTWDFGEFLALERDSGLRSAFYFAVVSRREGHPRDVCYDLRHSRYRNLLWRLKAGGWEIGLHAGYLTRFGTPTVAWQMSQLGDLAGGLTGGVRHHYLHLDRADPLRTLAAHADAGLLYDASIGFNDEPGFRAGIASPFLPYDADTGQARSFVELPTSIADMHLPREDRTAATDAVVRHLGIVQNLGGLAVLNWHVGHWLSAPAWSESYRTACRILADDSSVWVATPRDIASWWLRRAEALA